MKSRFIGFLGVLTLLFMGAQTASAAFTGQGVSGTFNGYGRSAAFFLEADFGGTAHSEVWNFVMSTSTDAPVTLVLMEIPTMSTAANATDFNNGFLQGTFTPPGPGGGSGTITYTTPTLQGVHRIVFWLQVTTGLVPTNIAATIDNGGAAATAVTDGGNAWDEYTSLTMIGASGTTAADTLYQPNTLRTWTSLGVGTDAIAFDAIVDHGTTATALNFGMYATFNGTGTGSGDVEVSLYDMTADGGQTPVLSITVTGTPAVPSEDAKTFLTPSRTGTHRYRMVVTGGTGFTASPETYAQIAWGGTPPFSATQVPVNYASPVTITPGGSAISTATQLTASGGSGTPSYAWSITSGTAATISPATGTTSTLTPTGTGSVTVRATNGTTGEWAEETYTIGGGGGGSPTITGPASIPDGVENVAYGPVTIVATGGTPPYTWSATGLPTGVSIDPSTGQISGTPTVNGTFASIVVTVTDSAAQNDVQNYSITIAAAGSVIISTSALPGGQVPNAYSQNVVAVGGAAPYAWQISAGNLPTGLTLGSSTSNTVAISGIPSAAGTFNFTIRVDENGGNFATRALSITIAPASGGGIGGGGGGGGGGGCASSTGNGAWWLLAVGIIGGVALYRRRKTA